MTEDRLARMFRAHGAIKAKMAENVRKFKEEQDPLKQKLALIETGLLKMLQETGSSLLSVKGLARVIPKNKTMPNCKDWSALWTHVIETGNFDLVTRRLSSKHIQEYMDNHGGDLPPGVTVHVERGVSVTRQN